MHEFLHLRYGKSLQNSSVFLSGAVFIIIKRDHIHPDAVKEPCLVNRDIDHMVPCPEKEVGFLGGLTRTGNRIGPPHEVHYPKITSRLLIYSITSGTTEISPVQALSLEYMCYNNRKG